MMHKTPIITVTCERDLDMLELQAQSIARYLNTATPVFIVVNEDNTTSWFDYFDRNIRHYYSNHSLTVLSRNQLIESGWNHWIPDKVNPWASGWETQQVLKLACAKLATSPGYVVLDTQNFLIDHWSPDQYNISKGKIPVRDMGPFLMPLEIWTQYAEKLGIDNAPHPSSLNVSITTPMFLHTALTNSLVETYSANKPFPEWFKYASNIKSEFLLYLMWVVKHNALEDYHERVDSWASPYLRDCYTEESFREFIDFVGVCKPHAWISINHRAWGNMTAQKYSELKEKLKGYGLYPKFDSYRSNYVDLKF